MPIRLDVDKIKNKGQVFSAIEIIIPVTEENTAPKKYIDAPWRPEALPLKFWLTEMAPAIDIGQIKPFPIPIRKNGANRAGATFGKRLCKNKDNRMLNNKLA